MLARVKAVHEVHSLEEALLVFNVQFCAHFEKPVNDSRSELPSDLYLICQQGIELRLVLVLDHVVVELATVQL